MSDAQPMIEMHGVTKQYRRGGETLTVLAADSSVIESFRYNDSGSWPLSPDGEGASLTRILPPQDPNLPFSWRPSVASGGSPGTGSGVSASELGPSPSSVSSAVLP